MKLKTFATATTTLLGAALVGYGQTQTEQRPDSVLGASSTEQTSGAAGTSATADQGRTGTAAGQPQTGGPGAGVGAGGPTGTGQTQQAGQAGQAAQPGQAGQPTQPGQPGQAAQPGQAGQAGQPGQPGETTQPGQAGQQQQQQQPGQQTEPGVEGTEAERAQRAQAMRELDWDDAEESQMQLNEIPERARNTLTTVTTGAQLEQQITRLNKDDHEVFRATVTRANEQDLHIFVAQDGTVVKTMQQVNFADAPESVRNAIREEVGEEPQELHRVIAADETSYVAKAGEAEDAPKIRVDNTGSVIESGEQTPGQEDRQPGTPQDQQGQPQNQQQGQQEGAATGPGDN